MSNTTIIIIVLAAIVAVVCIWQFGISPANPFPGHNGYSIVWIGQKTPFQKRRFANNFRVNLKTGDILFTKRRQVFSLLSIGLKGNDQIEDYPYQRNGVRWFYYFTLTAAHRQRQKSKVNTSYQALWIFTRCFGVCPVRILLKKNSILSSFLDSIPMGMLIRDRNRGNRLT